MANNYVSQFTGDELDFAISSALGDKYRGNLSPGCHTVGASTDMRVDFDTLTIPGKYTAYFYEHGPTTMVGVSPLCIQVFWGATMLYQTIQVGSRLFWRDLLSGDRDENNSIRWNEVELGSEAIVVIDNLDTDLASNDKASVIALSANMGAKLNKIIKNLQIGNVNLMDFSNSFDDYFHNIEQRWSHTEGTTTIEDRVLSDFVDNAYNAKFPMVDDVDRDSVSVFTSTGNGAFSFNTGESNRNPVQMAHGVNYTASVYVLCQKSYFDSSNIFKFTKDNSPKVYIKIIDGVNVLATEEKTLYQLFEEDYVSYTFEKNDGQPGNRVEHTKDSIGQVNGYVRLTVTYEESTISGDNIGIQFGMDNDASASTIAQFVYPKIEYGNYATQYNHSWQDLYYFFNNCEEIFGTPINIDIPDTAKSIKDCISNQSGLVFNSSTEEFDVEPVAVGGGGGFLKTNPTTASKNPRKDKIIIFDEGSGRPVPPGPDNNYRIRGLKALFNNTWETLVNSPLTLSRTTDGNNPDKVVQEDCGWLDNTNEDDTNPAVLKYWNGDRWRPVGAMPSKVWFIQDDVPTNPDLFNLIWIKRNTRAPYIYLQEDGEDTGRWVPLLALWGSPPTSPTPTPPTTT